MMLVVRLRCLFGKDAARCDTGATEDAAWGQQRGLAAQPVIPSSPPEAM